MAVRLFVGNLPYGTSEAELRAYFGAVAPPSQVVLPVDRETGRPRGFAFVEFQDRAHAEQAIQRFNGQPFNGRPLAVSEARARDDRGPRPGGPPGPRPGGGGFAPRPPSGGFSPRPFDPGAAPGGGGAASARSRNFGPDAKPQRGQKAKKKGDERPRGPIPLKSTGRSFTLDDADLDGESMPADIDDFATSRPQDDETEE